MEKTIEQVIRENIVNANSFIGEDGENNFTKTVNEINQIVKEKTAQVIDSIQANLCGDGVPSGIIEIFKDVAKQAINRSNF